MESKDFFKAVLLMSFFYAISVQLFISALPKTYEEVLINTNPQIRQSVLYNPKFSQNISTLINTLKSQASTDNYAILVFRTGNTFLNFAFNFIFAIPQIAGNFLILLGVFMKLDPVLVNYFTSAVYTLLSIVYLIWLVDRFMEIITGRRLIS